MTRTVLLLALLFAKPTCVLTVYLYYHSLAESRTACHGLRREGFKTRVEKWQGGGSCTAWRNEENVAKGKEEAGRVVSEWKPDSSGWHVESSRYVTERSDCVDLPDGLKTGCKITKTVEGR